MKRNAPKPAFNLKSNKQAEQRVLFCSVHKYSHIYMHANTLDTHVHSSFRQWRVLRGRLKQYE